MARLYTERARKLCRNWFQTYLNTAYSAIRTDSPETPAFSIADSYFCDWPISVLHQSPVIYSVEDEWVEGEGDNQMGTATEYTARLINRIFVASQAGGGRDGSTRIADRYMQAAVFDVVLRSSPLAATMGNMSGIHDWSLDGRCYVERRWSDTLIVTIPTLLRFTPGQLPSE